MQSFGGALREALKEFCIENFYKAFSKTLYKASCRAFNKVFNQILYKASCKASSIALVAREINYKTLTLN